MVFTMIFIGALYSTKNFQLDASSDTLILENDQDLNNYREVIKEYSSKDFLLITITSKSKIIIDKNIIFIKNLSDEISKLKWVDRCSINFRYSNSKIR
jgi:predicted RND superfamily exporter protein